MANERILPASKQSAGGIQPADLVVGEIAIDESTGVLVQKRADGGLDVYGKRGVLNAGEIQQLIDDTIQNSGSGGDMLKSTYDTDNDGKVDAALNADRLGGVSASDYASKVYADSAANAVKQDLLGGTPVAVYDTIAKMAEELSDDDNVQAQILTDLSNKITVGASVGGRIIA